MGLTRKSLGIPPMGLGLGRGRQGGGGGGGSPLSDVSPFEYLGSFNLPPAFDWAASAMCPGPAANTLYVSTAPASGSNSGTGIGCINVPTTLDGTQTATMYSGVNGGAVNNAISAAVWAALTEKTSSLVMESMYLSGGTLAVGYYLYYPGTRSQTLNYFTIDQNLDTGSLAVNKGIQGSHDAACYSYFGPIDSAWQSFLGYDMVSTQGVVSNDQVLSFGPSAMFWNSANIGNASISAKDAAFYPIATPIDSFAVGDWGTPATPPYNQSVPPASSFPNQYWAEKTKIVAVFAPASFRSLVFVYSRGVGFMGYGVPVTSTAQNALATTISCTGNTSTVTNPNEITSAVLSNPHGIAVIGDYVTGTGISANTTVTAYDSVNGILTLSNNVTASTTGGSFTLWGTADMDFYNPNGGGKGAVSYPICLVAVAYDLNDIASVLSGAMSPTSILPTFVGQIPTPTSLNEGWINVANGQGCYDPATGRLYAVLSYGGVSGFPIIGVWQLRASTPSALQCTDPIWLPSASIGTPYSYSLSIQGGAPPYTVTRQALVNVQGQSSSGFPAISGSGVLSGTPSVAELAASTLTITDSASNSIQRTLMVKAA